MWVQGAVERALLISFEAEGLDNRDWAAMAPDVFDAEDMYPNAQEAILDDLTAITDTMSNPSAHVAAALDVSDVGSNLYDAEFLRTDASFPAAHLVTAVAVDDAAKKSEAAPQRKGTPNLKISVESEAVQATAEKGEIGVQSPTHWPVERGVGPSKPMRDAVDLGVAGKTKWKGTTDDPDKNFDDVLLSEGFQVDKAAEGAKGTTGIEVEVQRAGEKRVRHRAIRGQLDWHTGPETYAFRVLEAERSEPQTNPAWGVMMEWLAKALPPQWRFEVDQESKTLYFSNRVTGEVSALHPDHEALLAILDFGRLLAEADAFDRVQILERSLLLTRGKASDEMALWSGPHEHADQTHFWYCGQKKLVCLYDPRIDIKRRQETLATAMRTITARLGIKPDSSKPPVQEQERKTLSMKSQLFGKVAEKSEAAAEAARQSLTLPDINAKGTVGKALPPKAKPKGPDAAELAQLQREEEARKKAEQERMRKEHIEKTELEAIRRTSKTTVAAAHIAGVPLVKGQHLRGHIGEDQADFAATAPLPKGNQLSTTLKSIEQQMTSKEFWDAPTKEKKGLSKSASAPDVRKQNQKKRATASRAPAEKPAPPKGVDKAQLAWASGTFPAGEMSDSIREEDLDAPIADPEPEPLQLPRTQESYVQLEAEPLSADSSEWPELIRKVPVPPYERTQLSLDSMRMDGSLPKRFGTKKPLQPMRMEQDRHRLYFTGVRQGPVKDGVSTARALNPALRNAATRMSRGRMIQAVEANRLAQMVGYTGAAVQCVVNPRNMVNMAQISAAESSAFDMDEWPKLRPDLVERHDTFHTAGVGMGGRYVSDKGRRPSDFSISLAEREVQMEMDAAQGV
jgi:hypothetical protein